MKLNNISICRIIIGILFLPLFDGLGLIIEEPAEPKVEASAEQHGVEEDAEDEDLLWNSDEVIIHCELDPVGGLLQCPLRGAGGAGHQTITTRLSFCFPFYRSRSRI